MYEKQQRGRRKGFGGRKTKEVRVPMPVWVRVNVCVSEKERRICDCRCSVLGCSTNLV